jgi:hypothetical protein
VDAHSAEILVPLLQEMGMPPQAGSDLVAAAEVLASQAFDIVFIDFAEEAAALQFATNIRKTSHNKKTQIIGLVETRNNVRLLFSAGCNFVLYKPLSKETAQDCLRAARGLIRREKRASKRVRMNNKAAIAYSSVENALATLLDLSETGVRIQSEKAVPSSCKVYFQFSLPGQPQMVRLSGEVVWQDSVGRVGLRFADVPQTSRKLLHEWLRSNRILDEEAQVSSPPESEAEPTTKRFGLGLLQASVSDRRIKSRHACQLGAEVYEQGSKVPQRCTLSDISAEGCYAESTAPFPVGTAVEIVVRTKNVRLEVSGTVQTMHRGFGMGVEFALKTPGQKNCVKQLIECAAQWGISV